MVTLNERSALFSFSIFSGYSGKSSVRVIFENERRKNVAKASTTVLLESHFILMCLKNTLLSSFHGQTTILLSREWSLMHVQVMTIKIKGKI